MASGIADNRTLSFGDVGAKKARLCPVKASLMLSRSEASKAGVSLLYWPCKLILLYIRW